MSRIGQFIERICKGAFKKAIERNNNVRILLNHDWCRDLGGTKEGNLELYEDNIGLHARATITDRDVIDKAREGSLIGWSFGFKDREVENSVEQGVPIRDVRDLDLYEVSILDRTKIPAYEGTLISVRSDEEFQYYSEPLLSNLEIRDEQAPAEQCEPSEAGSDGSSIREAGETTQLYWAKYENLLKEMKGEL